MEQRQLVELIIDEKSETDEVFAISVVNKPAIESDFIALSEEVVELKVIDEEKKVLMGAALIPNKKIPRLDKNDKVYDIWFSEATIEKASQLFLMRNYQNEVTMEHNHKLKDMSVVESWIIEDAEMDKSKLYGFSFPKGTWMVAMKVDNEDVWNDVKSGKIKGYSIEGRFSDSMELKAIDEEQELIEKIKAIILNKEKVNLESYTDYPEQASENAKIALRYAEENGWGDCGTPVGKARANQLANKEPISEDTISRMASFERQRQNSNRPLGEGCGRLMWLAWGGDAGVEWAQRKLEQIRNEK